MADGLLYPETCLRCGASKRCDFDAARGWIHVFCPTCGTPDATPDRLAALPDDRRTLPQRSEAEDRVAAAVGGIEDDEPTTALLYKLLRARGWSDQRVDTVLHRVGWKL